MTITRYTLRTSYASGAGIPGIVESLHGEYVRYADYLAAIAESQAEKVGLEAIVTAQAESILALRGNHSGGATDMVGAPDATIIDGGSKTAQPSVPDGWARLKRILR